MLILRTGKVRVPHKPGAAIILTRTGGSPLRLNISEIDQWIECSQAKSLAKLVVIYYGVSSVLVLESFDAIDQEINGKAVPHVE